MVRVLFVVASLLGVVACSNTLARESADASRYGASTPEAAAASSLHTDRALERAAVAPGDVGGSDARGVEAAGKARDHTPLEAVGLRFVAELSLVLTGDTTLLGAEPLLVEVDQGQLRVRPELSPGVDASLPWKYSMIGHWPNNAYVAATAQGPLTSTRIEVFHFDGRNWRKVALSHPSAQLSASFEASVSSRLRASAVVHTQDWTPTDTRALTPSTSYSILDLARGRLVGFATGLADRDGRCGTTLFGPSAISRSGTELVVAGTNCRDVFAERAGAVLLETFIDGKRVGSVSAVTNGWQPTAWPEPRFLAHVGKELFVLVEVIPFGNEPRTETLLHRETNFSAVDLPGAGPVSALRGTHDTLWMVRGGTLYGRRAGRWFRAMFDVELEVKTLQLDAGGKLWVDTSVGTYWQGEVANPIRNFATEGPLTTAGCLLGEVQVEFPTQQSRERIPAIKSLARLLQGFPLDDLLIADLEGKLQFIGTAQRARQLQERLSTMRTESRCGHGGVGSRRVTLDTKRGWLVARSVLSIPEPN